MSLARLARGTVVYMLLVAPPLAILFAVLHLGDGLQAPRAIGGDWLIGAAEQVPPPAGCPALDFGDGPAVLHVAQSGPRAEAALSDSSGTKLALELSGDGVTGGERGGGSSCRLALDAHLVVAADGGERLVGVLRRPGCAGCPDLAFRAARKPRSKAKR